MYIPWCIWFRKEKLSTKHMVLWQRELFSGRCYPPFHSWNMVLIYISAFHPVSYIPAALLSPNLINWNQESTPKLFVNSYVGKKRHIKLEDKMWSIFFPDSCFFCYAQSIHILTQRSGTCSAYVLKYNFCTVFCVIEHLAVTVAVEEMEEKRKLVEVDVKLQEL